MGRAPERCYWLRVVEGATKAHECLTRPDEELVAVRSCLDGTLDPTTMMRKMIIIMKIIKIIIIIIPKLL
jgi:hypothetical protein